LIIVGISPSLGFISDLHRILTSPNVYTTSKDVPLEMLEYVPEIVQRFEGRQAQSQDGVQLRELLHSLALGYKYFNVEDLLAA